MRKLKPIATAAAGRLFGAVPATGFPSPAGDYIESGISLDEYCIQHPSATFFFPVEGDSMSGVGILPGDLVIIDRSLKAQPRDIVVAVVDGEFYIRRLRRQRDRVYLMPAHPDYPAIIIEEITPWEVWGPVVGVIRKLK